MVGEPLWSMETTVSLLSSEHPASILLLGRHCTGEPQATGARLRFIEPDRLVLEVQTAGGRVTAQLMFLPPVRSAAEARAALAGLLRQVRAAHPEEPVTALERQLRVE
jgi:hypothetical protein